jgi:hypothetical protein
MSVVIRCPFLIFPEALHEFTSPEGACSGRQAVPR